MTEKEMMEFEKLTDREFMIWVNKDLNNKIREIEKAISFIAAEIERRKMTVNVDKIAVIIMQTAMKSSAKIMTDIGNSIEEAYETTDFIQNMPIELQGVITDVLGRSDKRIKAEHEKVNKKLDIGKEDVFRTKPK